MTREDQGRHWRWAFPRQFEQRQPLWMRQRLAAARELRVERIVQVPMRRWLPWLPSGVNPVPYIQVFS